MGNFFNGVWNVIKAPVVIFNFIALNWLGLVIGISVALIFIFAIWIISKHQPNTFLCVVLVLMLGIGGMFINNIFQSHSPGEVVTPEERIEDVSASSSKNWGNTNGGFTIEQIKQARKDNECPIHDDINYTINMSDMGDFVCFWYRNGDIVENAIFIKTNNGLVYDGLLKYTCRINNVSGFLFWMNYDLSSGLKWRYYNDNYPRYCESKWRFGGHNLVIASDGTINYSDDSFSWIYNNSDNARLYTYYNAQDFIGQNSSKFIALNGAELIGVKGEAFRIINSYYTYLWNNYLNGNTSNIDVTDYMCVVIPEDERSKYPVSSEFKQKYPDIDYYGVYKCDISVNLHISDCGKINSNQSSKYYIEKNKDKEESKVDNYEVKTDKMSKLYIELVDSINSDLSTLDLNKYPITINFKNDIVDKNFIIDSIDDLKSLRFITLTKDKTYNYTIYSEKVLFNSFSGTIDINSDNAKVTFSYSYLNDNVVLGVYLNPIGTIDESLIDLSVNPVKIILQNDKNTYVFDFTDNSQLHSRLSMLVELGDYNFTILSTKLIFAQVTGKLTVATDKNLVGFNYALTQNDSPLTFKTTITTKSSTSSNNILLHSDSSNVDKIRDTLTGNKSYNVFITIYSKDGQIMEQFKHIHYGVGVCSGNWSSTVLSNGTEYIAQLRFVDANDSTITYLSDTVTFTYENNIEYTFNYDVTINK